MKSFKKYITEAVPNRFHGQVFKQFYDMGRRGTYPWSSRLISQISTVDSPEKKLARALFGDSSRSRMGNEDAPEHMMRFPSFKNDSKGRILTIPVKTIPTDLENLGHLGAHYRESGINRIDLRKAKNTGDTIKTLGHEAFHSVQTARGNEGMKKFIKAAWQPHDYPDRWDPAYAAPADRNYRDSLGQWRTTNDLNYANSITSYPSHTYNEIKHKEFIRGSRLSNDEISQIQYRYSDREHDARIGGAIAKLASKEGSRSADAYADNSSPIFSYRQFLRSTDPQTRRQERKTRKAFGRIAQAWQDTTGNKINPDPEA